ncbi:hypothetical protein SAMN06296241_0369 [Salinimicrobium sediminis]|uniref:Replication-associated protein G2P N-terminal domain-containing protein n=1 Tax=Salinimicrobium sediminis TaxID=1343891 RepID=A0A285X0K8_9FLAO|nr:hypothetical protein [Salinimicrobium sediminis]SOC78852.1 hypothetical protein SAMN06296241_0369 [Salinimicrobium sediminis]
MIDFIKYDLLGIAPDHLEQNILLDFHYKVNSKTGELGKYKNAYFRGLEFKIFEATTAHPEQRITVEGSFHKYWNKGAHNFNDFGIVEVKQVLADLQKKFNIKPENCILRQLEIGVNIKPPGKTKSILKQCLLHKTDRLKWIFTKDEGNYIQARHQRHILKIYDKKTHYIKKGFKIEDEVMRVEIKYLKMHDLNKKGIRTLADLLKYGLENFTPELLKQWQNVIFYDFKALQGTKYENLYSNPNYWENLPYESLKYHRANLNRLTQSHPDNYKCRIAELIKTKADLLNKETTEINPLHIELESVVSTSQEINLNRKVCKVTGLNISMQKEESILLSHTGLRYYFKTDRKVYEQVKRKYLSRQWSKENHDIQIKEIAHNIRNRYNTQKIKREKLYMPGQPLLFDLNTLTPTSPI